MDVKRLKRLLMIFLLLGVSSCSPAGFPTATPPGAELDVPETISSPTKTVTIIPTLTSTPTSALPPMLTLDQNFFCNHGPSANYTDIVDFPAGTVLPIIGTNGSGWWLVAIDDERTHHTECWIGGGIVTGDVTMLPYPTIPGIFAPVHDESNWSHIIYLGCTELDRYRWVWNEVSSGEYVSTTPILSIPRPTIIYDEWIAVCPDWFPSPVVKVHDEATWTVVGYLTCSELETYAWTWNGASSGEYVASVSLFGSNRLTIYLGEITPICPGFSP